MDIFVTGHAGESAIPAESSRALRVHGIRDVAGDARCRPVGAGQGKYRTVVVFHGVRDQREALLIMASFAFAMIFPVDELTPVSVSMTVRTFLVPRYMESQLTARVSFARRTGMAGGALQLHVSAPQRESGHSMVELPARDLFPRKRRVASGAWLREFSVMGIGVAVVAAGERKSAVHDRIGVRDLLVVTCGALHGHVLPRQTISCTVMRELRRRLPPVLGMALVAPARELPPVLIDVARRARSPESHVRRPSPGKQRTDVGGGHPAPHMAGIAGHSGVFASERIPRGGMIELRSVKMNDAEIPAMMLTMTRRASAIAHGRMIPVTALNPAGDLRMTHEATVIGDRLANRVALRAVLDPFEIRMGSRELTRRDLGESRQGEHTEQ